MPAINRIDATARVNGKGRKAPADRSGKLPRLYLCMMYAGDRNAGKIIAFVVSWYPHAKRRRRGTQGFWSVFSRQKICEDTGLSLKQYKRAMPVAIRCGAIDFIIGGHAGKKAIFTRPRRTRFALVQVTHRYPLLKTARGNPLIRVASTGASDAVGPVPCDFDRGLRNRHRRIKALGK